MRFGGSTGEDIRFRQIMKEVDEGPITNDDVLSNDAELFFTVQPNHKYMVIMSLHINTGSTPDLKYSFSIPSGVAGDNVMCDGGDFWTAGNTGAVPQPISGNFVWPVSNLLDMINFNIGFLRIGATGGTVFLQWAQDVSNGAPTSMLQNSSLFIIDMGPIP